MKKLNENVDTHFVEGTKPNGTRHRQGAVGKADLIVVIRGMLKDGYTEITITVL